MRRHHWNLSYRSWSADVLMPPVAWAVISILRPRSGQGVEINGGWRAAIDPPPHPVHHLDGRVGNREGVSLRKNVEIGVGHSGTDWHTPERGRSPWLYLIEVARKRRAEGGGPG